MSSSLSLHVILLLSAIIVTCSQGLKIDFSRLSLPSGPYVATHKRSQCHGNPCESSKPFLCRDGTTCIRLNEVCDGTNDCEDGFDEDNEVCFANSRPSREAITEFLMRERQWMIPTLFNGADPELVAHALTVVANVEELKSILGLTQDNVINLRAAFKGTTEGDERPLLKLGMPERSWPEVKFLLESLLKSNFHV